MLSGDHEIERKYLLRALPAGIAEHPWAEIDQGYVPGTAIHERIRRITEGASVRYERTVKLGSGVDRLEFQEPGTPELFAALWPLTQGCRVRKRRYRVAAGARVWEVDAFLDRDLVLAEVELASADEPVEVPPAIAAVLEREVTDDPEFANHRLAR